MRVENKQFHHYKEFSYIWPSRQTWIFFLNLIIHVRNILINNLKRELLYVQEVVTPHKKY